MENFDGINDDQIRDLMSTGGDRYDTSKTYENEKLRNYVMSNLKPKNSVNTVVGLETYGLTLGILIANNMNEKFIPIREKNKIPAPDKYLKSASCGYSHRRKTLEIDIRRFESIESVLLVDDWIESGTQILTAIDLLGSIDIQVSEISVIGIDENFNTDKIDNNINLNKVI